MADLQRAHQQANMELQQLVERLALDLRVEENASS
jgi:hypothetical protein